MSDVPGFAFVPKDPSLALDPFVAGWLASVSQRLRDHLEVAWREEWNRATAELREAYVDTLPTSRKAASG